MAEYEYHATTATGEHLRGTISADDETAARRELQSRGLTIVDILWCPRVDDTGTLTDAQVTTLVDAIGTAASNRVPLELTLAVLAEDDDDPRLADVARRINNRLQQGATIDQAINELDASLPTELRGVVHAGIESGNLASAFEQFTAQRMESQRIGRRIRAAIAYPIVVLTIWVAIVLFLSLSVVPMFDELYTEFDLELPAMTEVLLQTSKQLPGLIAGLLIIAIVVPIVLRAFGGRWLLHRFRGALPLFGRLWTWSGQREFTALLASFLNLRIPLPRAVEYTGQLIGDRNIARACRRTVTRLEEGEPLGASLSQSISFDPMVASMVTWGESYGLLPDALRIASEVLEDRIEQHLSLAKRLIAPVTLIGIGAMAMFVIVALFIPLIKLIEGLS